jgi:hypothetical protein
MTEAPEHEGDSIEEIARQHPSADDGSQVQGAEQADNSEEQAQDGGPGAGEDYAGSGL